MENSKKQKFVDRKYQLLFWTIGMILLLITFICSKQLDEKNCEKRMATTIDFLKSQTNNYKRYNDTEIAKSLIRETLAVQALSDCNLSTTEEEVRAKVMQQWLTGITILDTDGNIRTEYTLDGVGYGVMQTELETASVMDVASYKQKTYTRRILLEDGSHIDVAIHASGDQSAIILAYRHVEAEFADKSVLSVQSILDGYPKNVYGTFIIAEGDEITASNDVSMIGEKIGDHEICHELQSKRQAEKLTPIRDRQNAKNYYGMYSHGRNYYLYTYIPEASLYDATIPNMAIAVVIYALLFSTMQILRFRTLQKMEAEQEAQRANYQRALERKNKELKHAIAQEEIANRAKRDFLFNMSHDIRTPMNAIMGFTSLAVSHIDNKEKVLEYLNKIAASSGHLLELINDVLDMSRIESGKVHLEEQMVHLPDVMHDVCDMIQNSITAKRLSFSIDMTEVQMEDVIADPLRLHQVMLNILSNAIKFTPAGGSIWLRVVQKASLEDGYGKYEFHIKDNGIGMSKEFQKHMFEQFSREQTSTVSRIQGTGLGLAIAKSIVDMMHGTISIESEPQCGTEVTITLCFAPGERKQTEKEQLQAPHDFHGKHVLLVEDNELNQEIAKTVLEEIGFEVDVADNGKKACEKIQMAVPGTYDVILMDIQMPVMDGYEATRYIRSLADEKKAQIPIFAMTANAFEEDKQNAFAAGMDGHIAKPIDIRRLIETLAKALQC